MKKLLILLLPFISIHLQAQNVDSLQLRQIYKNAITSKESHENLRYLCKETPGRLLGTENSLKAIMYMKAYAEKMGADTVFLQEFRTPAWIHESSSATLILPDGENQELTAVALGPSAATSKQGLESNLVEVMSLDEVEKLGKEIISGKIVFFNRPMKATFVNPFRAYGDAVDQRYRGPDKASEYGAAAVIVRSMTPNLDDIPHTGSCGMRENKIPAIAISTMDADYLSEQLKRFPQLKINLNVQAKDTVVTSCNLIADIRGKENPEEIILVGGHIDAWFNTEGAHDDAAGCVQAMDVLRIFKELDIPNKRTIRAVMYMDEELYQSGGDAYALYAAQNKIPHLLAIESDAGAFRPLGFTFDSEPAFLDNVREFKSLLEPYGAEFMKKGYGGVDIHPLKNLNIPLAGLNTVRQRYYDYHHAKSDTFEEVNFREMQLGTTMLASLIYLADKYADRLKSTEAESIIN